MIDEKKLIEDVLNTSKDISSEWETAGILNLIHKQPKVGEWIPVSERLPDTKKKPYDSVLLQCGDTMVVGFVNSQGQWFVNSGDGWCADLDDKPIAWQPLPEPYKE